MTQSALAGLADELLEGELRRLDLARRLLLRRPGVVPELDAVRRLAGGGGLGVSRRQEDARDLDVAAQHLHGLLLPFRLDLRHGSDADLVHEPLQAIALLGPVEEHVEPAVGAHRAVLVLRRLLYEVVDADVHGLAVHRVVAARVVLADLDLGGGGPRERGEGGAGEDGSQGTGAHLCEYRPLGVHLVKPIVARRTLTPPGAAVNIFLTLRPPSPSAGDPHHNGGT
jgi:hypothetical protein